MMGLTQQPHESLVSASFRSIKKEHVKKCVDHCMKIIY